MTKKTIICVDDEHTILDSLKEQLRRLVGNEYGIEVAEGGEEALDLMEEISIAGEEVPIIISDQIMPGMKGDELLMTVHDRFPSTLKIFLTGRANAEDVGNAVNKASLYRYISKPWNDEDFNLTIKEALRSYEQEKELVRYRNELEKLVKQRTEDLEKTQKELILKERLAFIGQLTSVIGHELRNPLGTIRTSIFAINESHCSQDPRIKQALERADRNVIRCDQIIEQLLEYSRTGECDQELIFLDDWVKHFLEKYPFSESIKLISKLNSEVKILLDAERFRRCLENVIENACESMIKDYRGSQQNNQLTISTRRAYDRVEVDIIDTGVGIPQEDLEKILTPIFSSKSRSGVGLGLPIVHQIMKQHNGGLEVQSELGKGTKVTLWLPTE